MTFRREKWWEPEPGKEWTPGYAALMRTRKRKHDKWNAEHQREKETPVMPENDDNKDPDEVISVQFRVPEWLHTKLKKCAKEELRSLNNEMVYRLIKSIKEY